MDGCHRVAHRRGEPLLARVLGVGVHAMPDEEHHGRQRHQPPREAGGAAGQHLAGEHRRGEAGQEQREGGGPEQIELAEHACRPVGPARRQRQQQPAQQPATIAASARSSPRRRSATQTAPAARAAVATAPGTQRCSLPGTENGARWCGLRRIV